MGRVCARTLISLANFIRRVHLSEFLAPILGDRSVERIPLAGENSMVQRSKTEVVPFTFMIWPSMILSIHGAAILGVQ